MRKGSQPDDAEGFRSIRKAARYCGLSGPTFVNRVLPHIPHRRVGRRVIVSRTAIDEWLNGHDMETN